MLHNRYHLELKIPAQFSPRFPTKPEPISGYDISWIDKGLTDWLLNFGYLVTHAEVFFRHPDDKDSGPIHVDGSDFDDHVKINYVYCDTPSLMNWYLPKEARKVKRLKTEIGTDFLFSEPEHCSLVYSVQVGQPSLVNSGMLHNVSAVSSPRFCFSFVLFDKSKQKLVAWDEAINVFSDFSVNI